MLRRGLQDGFSASRATRSQLLKSTLPLQFRSSLYTSRRTSLFGPVVIKPIPIPIPAPPFPQSRHYITTPPEYSSPKVDKEAVKARKSVEVSPDSTTRHIFDDVGEKDGPPQPVHMGSALAGDLRAVRETFALKTVPRDAYMLGLAGTVPYLSTSLGTLYCAWELNYAATHGNGLLFSPAFADAMLVYLENLQIGYGAVILSFLGAIHWGLEFAGFGNTHSRLRYGLGLLAPLVAWPTVMFTYEYALGAQFAGFVMMYWVDSRLASRGLAPYWYSTYRFVLTLVVGASIVICLIGRGEVEVAKQHGGDRSSKRELVKDRGEDGRELRTKYEGEKARIYDEKKRVEEAKKAEEEKKEEEKKKAEEKADNTKDEKKDDSDDKE